MKEVNNNEVKLSSKLDKLLQIEFENGFARFCKLQQQAGLEFCFSSPLSLAKVKLKRVVVVLLFEEMDPKLTEISQLFDRFKAALLRNDFDSSSNLLSQLKQNGCGLIRCEIVIVIVRFEGVTNKVQKSSSIVCRSPNAVQQLTIARDIYEYAVVLSVKTEYQDAFERDFFPLKPYYTDARNRLPQSPQGYPILGLNLLRLLVQNWIAEFHTELELLSSTALENPCIKHAVELEQSFMEGAYNRVLSARQTVPHETYVYFMDLLAKTIRYHFADPFVFFYKTFRDEIAGCSEKAYDYL